MQFKDVIGQEEVKERLRRSVTENKVAHTQLFLGREGCGSLPLAIAFAQYINCKNKQNGDSCGKCSSCIKYQSFAHPDLHFIFPTITSDSIKKPHSELYLDIWRKNIIKQAGYVTQSNWNSTLGLTGSKQNIIYARDASDIINKLNIKSYEADYKVIIIYLPERLHNAASNKLLKTFEEPPEKSLIFMVAERYELLLPTVRSRAQLIKIPPLKDEDIRFALASKTNYKPDENTLLRIVSLSNGNWNKALQLIENVDEEQFNFIQFRNWMRLCFKPGRYIELINFAKELARLSREKQKNLLVFGMQVIHNSLLSTAHLNGKIKTSGEETDFINKFSPFINLTNMEEFYRILNEAVFHLERNANANILFGELSLKMVKLLNSSKKSS